MLSPSTAPRWKRHTKTAGDCVELRRAYAARFTNSGSRPRLTNARPPDFTNTRLENVIVFGTPGPPARGERDGGVHAAEQRAAVHPLGLGLGVAGRGRLEIEGLAESRDDLREAERRVRLGSGGADGADDELERRLDLGAQGLRRPEVR